MKECGTGTHIAATLVAALRQRTGAGFTKCKAALEATQGNVDEAEKWLKIQGVKPDVLARATKEGAIAVKLTDDNKRVAMIELLCETDFAGKGEHFLKLADDIAGAVLKTPVGSTTEALNLKVGEETIHQILQREISGVIKENLKLNHVTALGLIRRHGAIGSYVHSNKKLAVIVGIVTESDDHLQKPEFKQLLKDISVHIAGTPSVPQAIHSCDLPHNLVESQKQIFQAQLDADPKNAKKPDNIKAKIIDGKMSKYFQEVALMDQAFVKDETKSIRQVVEETSKAIGAPITIDWFIRRTLDSQCHS